MMNQLNQLNDGNLQSVALLDNRLHAIHQQRECDCDLSNSERKFFIQFDYTILMIIYISSFWTEINPIHLFTIL